MQINWTWGNNYTHSFALPSRIQHLNAPYSILNFRSLILVQADISTDIKMLLSEDDFLLKYDVMKNGIKQLITSPFSIKCISPWWTFQNNFENYRFEMQLDLIWKNGKNYVKRFSLLNRISKNIGKNGS